MATPKPRARRDYALSRRPPPTPLEPSPTLTAALREIETAVGGREALISGLQLAPPRKDLLYVLGLVADPSNDARSLASICAQGGISPGELLEAYKQGVLAKAQVRSMHAAAEATLPVVADLMRRAAPYEEPCATCMVDGVSTGRVTADPTKKVPNPLPEPCPDCQGSKRLQYHPDLSRQKLALELVGMIKSSGMSIQVAQVNQGSGAAGSGSFGELLGRVQRLTDELLDDASGGASGESSAPGDTGDPPIDADVTPVGGEEEEGA